MRIIIRVSDLSIIYEQFVIHLFWFKDEMGMLLEVGSKSNRFPVKSTNLDHRSESLTPTDNKRDEEKVGCSELRMDHETQKDRLLLFETDVSFNIFLIQRTQYRVLLYQQILYYLIATSLSLRSYTGFIQ